MNDEPTIGSPPIPTIVEQPSPSCVSSWPIWYVSVPDRETRPIEPSRKISAGMIPTFAFPGDSAPGQFGPTMRTSRPCDERVEAQHLVRRNALGDADDGPDARADRLVHRVRGERRRDEDHRRVRAGLGDGRGDRVEDGDALDVLPALPRRHARDDVRAVRSVPKPVEAALGARQPLDDEAGVGVDEDRHQAASSTARRAPSSIVASVVRFGERRLGQDPPPLLGVRPVEPDDDRKLEPHLPDRLQDPARDLVAARDPAEDVEEDGAHLRVARDDLERVDHALRVASAAEVAEVRGASAGERHDVDASTSSAPRRSRGRRPRRRA